MMRRILASLLLALAATGINAQLRSVAERMQIASNTLARLAGRGTLKLLAGSEEILEGGTAGDAFSVYGYADGRPGFVIVSADRQSHPVLAFSATSHFSNQQMPESTRSLLGNYARRVANHTLTTATLALQPMPITSRNRMHRAPAREVEPLLGDICFDQGEPYNLMCPTYQGEPTLTGCTATAMAQVMAYHRHPEQMTYDPEDRYIAYSTPSLGIWAEWDMQATRFDWDRIAPTYTGMAPDNDDCNFGTEPQLTLQAYVYEEQAADYILLEHLKNPSPNTFSGKVRLYVGDQDGNFLSWASEDVDIPEIKPQLWWYSYFAFPCLPGTLPDGTHRIYAASKQEGSNLWQRIADGDAGSSTTLAQKQGSHFILGGHKFACGYTQDQAQAVATLLGACAHSLQVDFTPYATSGSYNKMVSALVAQMDYSDRIQYVQSSFVSRTGLHRHFQQQLQSRQPVLIAGNTADNSDGHAFVVDGYRTETADVPYYHVNWGWSGHCNGYFLIDHLQPSLNGDTGNNSNYSDRFEIISNIKPMEENDETPNMLAASSVKVSKSDLEETEDVRVTLTRLSNCSYRRANDTDIYAYAVDSYGNSFEIGYLTTIDGLPFNYYYNTVSADISIPGDIPTGDYTLELRTVDYSETFSTTMLFPNTVKLHLTTSTDPLPDPDGIRLPVAAQPGTVDTAYDLSGRPASGAKGIRIQGGRKTLAK